MTHDRNHWLHFIISTCYLVLLLVSQTNCLRIPKEELRSKSKCHTNVTHGESMSLASRCIALNHPYCLDIRLPYNSTILPDYLTEINLRTFDEVNNFLERWRGVKKLPKCWPVLQVALCSLLMPQCEEEPSTGRVSRFYRPNVDICNDLVNKEECRFLARQLEDWPSLFNCSDQNIYAKNCTNELRVLKFSGSTGQPQCQYPLVASNDDSTWFKDISGCAVHCKFPVTNISDQTSIGTFIRILCAVGLLSTISAIIILSANKTTSKNSRMAKVIKRCTWCQLLVYIGWSLQTIHGSDLACSQSGSTLYGLSLVANACVLSFLLTYLPSLASLFWCAHLGKLAHQKLIGKEDKSLGNAEIDRALSLFNYGIPLTLFVCVAFLGHIDGRGLHGICTVGQQSLVIKSIFVFAPTLIGTLYGNYFFMRIIAKLWFEVGTTMEPALWRTFLRIVALAVLTLLQLIFETANYAYEHLNQARWLDSVDKFVGCHLNLNNLDPALALQEPYSSASDRSSVCSMGSKPLIMLDFLEILAKLTLGIVIASYAFYEANYRSLRRKLIHMLEDDKDRQMRARNFMNHNGELAKLQARCDDNLERTTFPDLIDMASPTRFAGAKDAQTLQQQQTILTSNNVVGLDVDEDDEDEDENSALDDVEEGNKRRRSTETPSSLGSTALPSGLNSENSSIQHNNVAHVFRKVPKSQRGKTSRDVVNDCKQLKQLQGQHLQGQQQQPPPMVMPMLPPVYAAYLMFNEMQKRFNPPNLSDLSSDSVPQPQFQHGICNYMPAQEEAQQDSGVQTREQEESKT